MDQDENKTAGWSPEGAAPDLQETSEFPMGPAVSHYRILGKLGAGGMGVVYKAVDTKLDRVVALKFLPPAMRHNAELKRRLTAEARAASALDHPNIVVIHDIDETPGGDLFIAMTYHEGATLRERIASGLTPAEALRVARQIAAGLARAHGNGIVHRDIKPANIIVANDGVTRIIDFGLARSLDMTATVEGGTKGTPLYMSPEQASGTEVDFRTDLWSLGAVVYEMLTGNPPYRGNSHLQVMRAIVDGAPPRLRDVRPDLPHAIDAIVARAMQKEPAQRYASAAEMERDLSSALAALDAPPMPARSRRSLVYVAVALLAILAVAAWFYRQFERRQWAREQAIPGVQRLRSEDRPVGAFVLLHEAQKYLPGDLQLTQAAEGLTRTISLHSSPSGALIEIKDYLAPGEPWLALGSTPLENVTIPIGYLRWRASKVGVGELLWAPPLENVHGYIDQLNFSLDLLPATPQGMVPVPAVKDFGTYNWWFGFLGPYNLPQFSVDRYEVTNREFQAFVDQGGYQKREYWKENFVRGGKELSWEEAMTLLRDGSGRAGPATWEAGHFAAGQADFPVGGVSWYEAAAYAEFAGKKLPVLSQWYLTAPPDISRYIIEQSNFSALGPVGKHNGVGAWGTYDMAGNVSEWIHNGPGGSIHYIAGGAWDTSAMDYGAPPIAIEAFDRSAHNGFRCVRNSAPLPAKALEPVIKTPVDLSSRKPASDEVFRGYRGMYAYDRTPLRDRKQPVDQDSPDWRKEAVTFDAAYNSERMTAYLFLPANIKPPFQTVVFFPSARPIGMPSSKSLADMKYIDYIVKSGRAVIYPVYKGMYERSMKDEFDPTTAFGRDVTIQQYKDLARSIDYLETRSDIDRTKIGYLGFSLGGPAGIISGALDERLKVLVLLEAGVDSAKLMPGIDPLDFAQRVKQPVLMINGTYDMVWAGYEELFSLLGTAATDKKLVKLQTGHAVGDDRTSMVREVTTWLDKYLGRVN